MANTGNTHLIPNDGNKKNIFLLLLLLYPLPVQSTN